MRNLLKLLVTIAFIASSGAAFAQDSFQGSIWTLTYGGSPLADSDPLTETYRITLGVDTSSYTGGGSYLDQVAIKVSSSIIGATLYDAPGGTSAWSLQSGGINAAGCSGSGGGFECADSLALSSTNSLAVGSSFSWVFDVTMANGALFTGFEESSVKGRFVDALGNKVGDLVSEHVTLTTPVPEPEIYAMMLAGLGLMGFVARRRQRQGGFAAA